ncbi:NINE protein [Halosimplex marinum]|uniref:zinc-ribbon domain and TM2 domain-containing protein n=1 Tax=Halosimplex marinum TaxID=3396620 RepID=UPI003F5518B8
MSNDEPDDRDGDPGNTESGEDSDWPPSDDGGDTESGQGGGQQPTDDGGDRTDDGSDDSWVSDSVDESESTGAEGGPGDAGTVDDAGGSDAGGQSAGSDGGQQKGPNEKFCSECGAVINEKAEICPECGVRQPGAGSSGGDERLIAAVLAIVLGGLGAHKFYMGKVGQGIVYLCFSWTLIPALIGLVEGIIYLTKSDEEFHEQYMAD